MRKKKSSLTTTIIIILVIAVGVILGYVHHQDQQIEQLAKETENDNKYKKITPTVKEEKEEEIKLDNDIVKEAEASTEMIGAFNKYTEFNVEELSKRNLIETALNGLDDNQINFCISSRNQIKVGISIDDLNKSLNKYIADKTLTIDDIKENAGDTSLTVKDYGYGSYAIVINGDTINVISDCDGRGNEILAENIIASTVKATTKGNNLYLYKKVAYGRIKRGTATLSYTYYKDANRTEEIETITIDTNPTWDKYDTYVSTYEKKNDIYYLISAKKEG